MSSTSLAASSLVRCVFLISAATFDGVIHSGTWLTGRRSQALAAPGRWLPYDDTLTAWTRRPFVGGRRCCIALYPLGVGPFSYMGGSSHFTCRHWSLRPRHAETGRSPSDAGGPSLGLRSGTTHDRVKLPYVTHRRLDRVQEQPPSVVFPACRGVSSLEPQLTARRCGGIGWLIRRSQPADQQGQAQTPAPVREQSATRARIVPGIDQMGASWPVPGR